MTSTTPGGNLEQPLDLCATVGADGAAWAGRATSFDSDLAERIAEAVATPGFALLDIWELCTTWRATRSRKKRSRSAREPLLRDRRSLSHLVKEYTDAYREAHAAERGAPRLGPQPIEPRFTSSLAQRFQFVIAGSAGGKVRSAARLLAQGAILSGLYAAQRDDYPITVKTGHSVSELILSPTPIDYTGTEQADALLVLTEDGRQKSGPYLRNLAPGGTVFALPGLGDLPGRAADFVLDLTKTNQSFARADLALATATAAVDALRLFPIAALEEAARTFGGSHAQDNLSAIVAGTELAANQVD